MEFLTAGPAASLWATLILAAVLVISQRSGQLLLEMLGFREILLSRAEFSLFATGAGLVLVSLGVLGIGMAGFLYPSAVLSWLTFLFALSFLKISKDSSAETASKPSEDSRAGTAWVFSLSAALLFLAWLQVLLPPTGMDALSYHLQHPRQFILHHRVAYVPFTRESLWPYQTEMLFTLGLLLQGTTLAQLFHWVFYGLTAWGIWLAARRLSDATTASLAALFFLASPAAFAQSGTAYVDLSLAFFTLLAAYPLLLDETPGDARPPLLSGVFAGAACGTKYLGLGAAAVLGAMWFFPKRARWKNAAFFTGAALAAGGVWYARSFLVLGNPVYPFFRHAFGGSGFYMPIGESAGLGKSVWRFATLLWDMTLRPVSFGGPMIGPLYLLFIPLLVLALRRASRQAVRVGVFALFYAFFLFHQSQQVRFFLSVLPFVAIAAARGFREALRSGGILKKVAVLALGVAVVTQFGVAFHRLRNGWGVLWGKTAAADYLRQHERSFKLYEYLRANRAPSERLFNTGEGRFFYGPPDMEWDSTALYLALQKEGKTFTDYLGRNRFDWILLCPNSDKLFFEYVKSHEYKLVFSYSFYEKPAAFYYLLYHRT